MKTDPLAERDRWIRLFNRLQGAVARHVKAKEFLDEHDEALHSAHECVLREAAERDGGLDPEAIHGWFGLTYANYLVIPRSVLQSMPVTLQDRFVGCLDEMQEMFGHLDWPTYDVRARGEGGRYRRDPIPHYHRGRTRLEPRPIRKNL